MDIRKITDSYAVSPQIAPEDLPDIVAAGFRTVICNRPDDEVPMELQAETLRIATEAAGLTFIDNPVTHAGLNPAMVELQKQALDDSDGPVLAYCASGNRSSIVWSLGQAGTLPVDEIIEATSRAGYDLSRLRPMLEAADRS
ncbi:TIGR01244 family phosphatase [Ponticoccus sp. SC2-23]|uniref:TIGR01244 family sulfur transferase n=1 Tax=Alexandriicola marinus TaxID=2081710 RepID=UPI000FD6DDC1|nr:TIGR01244 family sulfur transferase [Alexandriicola marinus]MBM1219528.1 TIGR01244 family phosphatase [Ponticoccus sp. SC6-9]MBM1223400.1 TIGR01244 family phosphatase [Ponticoccus sp. SC6-15]MBM1229341.1 TIGR01244 family phosphatase [Ponticoccus sp. SC6-38]MBM1232366.1 TIGR01244 family phosphatase [Ponticoccus sp. SC6-45]MBM1237684.1 TIGR01244 family phosphatase [Ponticoccus sp. SC6-49]MBM1241377.1 TIGR01244 family phosphatase [Ponticoccus sp. SC2-64]MBM1245890.1 TIGR01244 family phosphat